MCDKAILETLESVPDCYKNQDMCYKAVDNYPDCYMIQKCVTKLPILIILQYNLFLNAIRLKKYVIKLLIDVFLHLLIFLIDITNTQEMCDRAISEDTFT